MITNTTDTTPIPRGGQTQSDRAALVALLERKGLLAKAMVLEETKQLRATSGKAR